MRILYTAPPAYDHILSLAPIAAAAVRCGHQVAICAPERFSNPVISELGLEFIPAGQDWVREFIDSAEETVLPDQMADFTTRFMVDMFCGEGAAIMARDVAEVIEKWGADLVIRDACEFGGYLAAEKLGLPHVSVAVLDYNYKFLVPGVTAALNLLRAGLDLPPDPDGSRAFAHLHVDLAPAEFQPEENAIPNIRRYRPDGVRPGQRLPDWITELDPDKPLVYASFGTAAATLPEYAKPLSTVIAGLGQLDCTAIVSTGKAADWETDAPVARDAVPPNVHLAEWVPQALLVRCVDLVVTHSGPSTVRMALAGGVPMVSVPLLFDAFDVAQRCTDLGISIKLDWTALTPGEVADACRRVLTEPGFRRRSRAIQRRALALPPVDDALIRDLENLAT
ncbi:glycosyltransferase [Crossiella cryophila]